MSCAGFKIAIVGSGPSGCYAAQFLNKSLPNAAIYVFEKMPVPYGLLRYGIAADHQGSKNVSNQYDRVFKQDNVFFCGNVSIGQDLSFNDLKDHFNLVILATGLENDKKLNLPVDEKCKVIGAGALLKSLNSHPNYIANNPSPLGSTISIIGAGNVAMDVVRLLCVQEKHLVNSDIYDRYLNLLRSGNIKKIDVFSRSAAQDAKFDLSMLKEIIALEHVQVSFSDEDQFFASLQATQSHKNDTLISVCFHFNACPEAIQYQNHQNQLIVKRRNNDLSHQFESDYIITAIGFENDETLLCTVKSDWAGDSVFKVGWLSSAGNGTVAANRKAVKVVVDEILHHLNTHPEYAMCLSQKFNSKIEHVIQQSVTFEQWQKIDEFEKRFKPANRCRRKVTTTNLMLMIASGLSTNIEKQTYINVA